MTLNSIRDYLVNVCLKQTLFRRVWPHIIVTAIAYFQARGVCMNQSGLVYVNFKADHQSWFRIDYMHPLKNPWQDILLKGKFKNSSDLASRPDKIKTWKRYNLQDRVSGIKTYLNEELSKTLRWVQLGFPLQNRSGNGKQVRMIKNVIVMPMWRPRSRDARACQMTPQSIVLRHISKPRIHQQPPPL